MKKDYILRSSVIPELWKYGAIRDKDEAKRALSLIPSEDVVERPRWIPVEERLPKERDSIFAKLYGTEKWNKNMFRGISDDVRVVVVFKDGSAMVWHDHTVDGKWSRETSVISGTPGKITHWMENPELPKMDKE